MSSLAWLWVLLSATSFLITFALENPQILRSSGFLISTKELPLSDLQENDSDRRELIMASENITQTEKGRRGRGPTGGSNVVYRRPPEKSAASPLLHRPHFFITSTILGLCFSLLLAFPFPLS